MGGTVGGAVVAGTAAVGSAVLVGIAVGVMLAVGLGIGLGLGLGVGLEGGAVVAVGRAFAATATETTSSFPISPLNSAASRGTQRDALWPGMRTCSQWPSRLRPTAV